MDIDDSDSEFSSVSQPNKTAKRRALMVKPTAHIVPTIASKSLKNELGKKLWLEIKNKISDLILSQMFQSNTKNVS